MSDATLGFLKQQMSNVRTKFGRLARWTRTGLRAQILPMLINKTAGRTIKSSAKTAGSTVGIETGREDGKMQDLKKV